MVSSVRASNRLVGIFGLLLFGSTVRALTNSVRPSVAIIGGGISGCSTAYFLRQLLGADAVIDIYESGHLGGRLATTRIADHEYEVGGSVLHPRNKYMSDFVARLGLQKKKFPDSTYVIWNGKEIVYRDFSKSWLMSTAKLLWRYGLSPFKTASFMEKLLSGFENIYDLQDHGVSFENVTDLLAAMDTLFPELTQLSISDALKEHGIKELFLTELVSAILRINYGQSTDAHAFVGSVSLAGAGDGLWAVQGGNKLVPEKLLNISEATLIPSIVSNVDALASNYRVISQLSAKEYEQVIIAYPLTPNSNIAFSNIPGGVPSSGKMHHTVCTMVHGALNASYFGLDGEELPKEFLTINDAQPFTSISLNSPVDTSDDSANYPTVYKVFSKEPLSDNVLHTIFSSVIEAHVTDWQAYPAYDTPQSLGSFVLHRNLFYVNTIEWAASAMEMSVVGARNVALLAAKARNIPLKAPYAKTEL